ncbi:spermatogenesis associated 6-like protein isoform X2 [Pelobates fuscus]|uniref:spermatogenesis associated 6-like protein isoform X2 n=1 Tax=Pelobates fuscus TaxID=191477 RepID=UPI002FE48251
MPLKVVVELQIHAVTCPGVFLPERDDIFLSVSVMNQNKETGALPAVFPLLFHEKMRFEKVFRKATDPAAVAQLLETGDILASYEENNRDFLFPEPKLTPPYPGVGREVLMKTAHGFPGIAPKVEFSTRTTIKETSRDLKKKCHVDHLQARKYLSKSQGNLWSPENKSGSTKSSEKNYNNATRSSKSRSPSPYTKGRMCVLNKDNQKRLARLNLGNSESKSNSEKRPPFIVRHVDGSKSLDWISPPKSAKAKKHSRSSDRFNQHQLRRALSFDSFQDETAEKKYLDKEDLRSSKKNVSFEDSGSASGSAFEFNTRSPQDEYTDQVLRSSLRKRFQREESTWEIIHNRVRSLLSTHSAQQRLSYDISKPEVDQILDRSVFSKSSPNNRFLQKRF